MISYRIHRVRKNELGIQSTILTSNSMHACVLVYIQRAIAIGPWSQTSLMAVEGSTRAY